MLLKNMKVDRGNPLVMGATVIGDCVNFAITAKIGSKCEVVLYEKGKKEEALRIPFEKAQVIGNVYAMSITGLDYGKYDYNFSVNGEIITDAYAKAITGKEQWGRIPESIRGVIVNNDFDWQTDSPLRIPFDETIMYRLHVRGFTKHVSSKSKHKGTYLGIVDKISYLKKLGITMVELMPAYEFNEVRPVREPVTSMQGQFQIESPTLNYWGYTDGFAFAPKNAYAFTDKPGGQVNEFKYMVKELHKNGIEISMEFFFPTGTNPTLILDALHYWVMEYHIDGIHVNCEDAVMKMIETDNLLCTTKIFTYSFAANTNFYDAHSGNRNLANFNDDFMICARKFIKGDEDMLSDISYRIKANPPGVTVVNYIANHNTFTLYDTVSYDRKYNEANGENNNDGAVYNYSWNCGVEGDTKKRKIMELRKKQIKNALCMVLLSQGVPMIYAGDEMCNSQKGNNNPYCLDNEISWTNWNTTAMAKEILEFTKKLIRFRKEHKILHLSQEPRQMDYKSYGLPDMSIHGTKAWYADFSHFNRHFSAMYCGKYAASDKNADRTNNIAASDKNSEGTDITAKSDKKPDGSDITAKLDRNSDEEDIIVAYNMFWKPMQFGIPAAGNKRKWRFAFTTESAKNIIETDVDRMLAVAARSVVILVADKKE